MADQYQNPGRKWRQVENDGDGNKYFDHFRFTPFTTDLEFFKDHNIYEVDVVRISQKNDATGESEMGPTGYQRPDERIKVEINQLLSSQEQFDASGIGVDVEDGVVTLSGGVTDPLTKEMAGKYIQNVFGILDVNNNLKTGRQEQKKG